jgi:hypothetical protein
MRALLLLIFGLLSNCAVPGNAPEVFVAPVSALTPRETTYLVDGEPFTLRAGRAEIEVAPGAASKTVVEVYGEPISGDLDGDGVPDAALLLVQTSGGSGTFYHVAAALNRNGMFFGTGAVFIGDRIAPQQLAIRHGVVIVDYADRRPGEAMTTPPSLGVSKYLVSRGEQLVEVLLAAGELIVAGEVVIGHEVRSFTPCGAGQAAWLLGDSPALPAVMVTYHLATSDASPYTPLLMVLTGQPAAPPAEGFGADFSAGFRVSQLIHSLTDASCTEFNRASR